MTSQMKSNNNNTRTLNYQRVQKPLLERQRRARINKCLDALKQIMADCQHNDAIRHMDKAEMLESTIKYMRKSKIQAQQAPAVFVDSYKNGYMNAVNEVSRVLASTPGMNVELGKSVMMHLGRVYNRIQHQEQKQHKQQQQSSDQMHQKQNLKPLIIDCMSAPLSPASSGYHSDIESPQTSPVNLPNNVWRPW